MFAWLYMFDVVRFFKHGVKINLTPDYPSPVWFNNMCFTRRFENQTKLRCFKLFIYALTTDL